MQKRPRTDEKKPKRPKICPRCGKKTTIYRHGTYKRYRTPSLHERIAVPRFYCLECRRTWSILPILLLPYRPIETVLLQRWFDARYLKKSRPKVRVLEQGCLERAAERFEQRTRRLATLLGLRRTARTQTVWKRLRSTGTLAAFLKSLGREHHTSLLGDYASVHA